MATLPDFESLGGLPSANSGRQIASYDTSAIGRGVSMFGQGLSTAGTDLAMVDQNNRNKVDDLDTAKANSSWLTSKVNLDEAKGDLSDPADLEAHKTKYSDALNTAANLITDPAKRQKFLINNQPSLAYANVAVNTKIFDVNKDQTLADTTKSLSDLQNAGVKATSDVDKGKILDAGKAQIDALEEKGYISAVQANSMRKNFAEGYAESAVKALTPQQQIATLGGWKKALYTQESGGDPSIVNPFGFAGLGQFGAPRLQTLGVYTPGVDEDMSTWNKTGRSAPGKWSGTFNIPGFGDVKTLRDFLQNPAAQESVFDIHTNKMDSEMQSMGLNKYIGQTVGGIPITKEGIYSMAHLGGMGGAQNALEGNDSKDANGSSVLGYARFGLAGPSHIAAIIPEDRKVDLMNAATRAYINNQRQFDADQQAEKVNVANLLKDDQASLMNTGKPLAEITPQRVNDALGSDATTAFLAHRDGAQRYYDQTKDWDSVPEGTIAQRLESLRPQEGKAGFNLQQSYYQAAAEKAQALVKLRSDDPAGSVSNHPDVQAARQNITNDPTSYQPLIKARMIAQQRIGIPEEAMSPITEDEAKHYAASLRPVSHGQMDVSGQMEQIQSVAKAVSDKYGNDAQKAMQRILYHVTMKPEAAEVLAAAMLKLHNGGDAPLVSPQGEFKVKNEQISSRAAQIAGEAPPPKITVLPDPPSSPPPTAANIPQKPFSAAQDLLRSNPQKLMGHFIEKYGVNSVPPDLRNQIPPELKGADQ